MPPRQDSDGLWNVAAATAEQLRSGVERAREELRLDRSDRPRSIVITGMGGSGIAGDVVAAVVATESPILVTALRGYRLPAWVGKDDLVVAASFSGNTEETLSVASHAFERGCRVVALTQGGRLGQLAQSHSATVVSLPTDLVQPRSALAALVAPQLVLVDQLGLWAEADAHIDAAVAQLSARAAELTSPDSPAAEFARRVGHTWPVVYGGDALGEVAARRWKGQFNENSKIPSFFNFSPELCHNEIVGFGQHGDVTRQVLTLVFLRHDFEHPQTARRFEFVARLLDETVASVQTIRAAGDGRLAQFFDLALIGDFASLHLAFDAGLDPGPVPVLGELKSWLATR